MEYEDENGGAQVMSMPTPLNSGEQVCLTCASLTAALCCVIAPLAAVVKLCGRLHVRCHRKAVGPKYGAGAALDEAAEEAQRKVEESQLQKQAWKKVLAATTGTGGVLLRTPYPQLHLHQGSIVRVRGVRGLAEGAAYTVSRVLEATQFELRAQAVDDGGEPLGPHLFLSTRAAFRVLPAAPISAMLRKLGFGGKAGAPHAVAKKRSGLRRPPGFTVVEVGVRRSSRDAKRSRAVAPAD
jgi:hypothetical protein